jgi:hypothetical protein
MRPYVKTSMFNYATKSILLNNDVVPLNSTKMKKIIYLICLLFSSISLTAQVESTDGFGDCLYYTNGGQVYGKIVYYVPTDTLVFQLANGQTLRCAPSIVKKVVMAKPKTTATKAEKPYAFRERGRYVSAAYAMSFGRNKNGSGTHTGVGIQASAGYLFNRKIGIGGGLAYDSYYLKDGNANVLAGFCEARGYFSKRPVAEFFTLAIGYGQPMKTDNFAITNRSGGVFAQPTIGLRFGASARYNFFAELGVRFQQVHYEYTDEWVNNKYAVTYQRWVLRGGILF